MKANTRNIMESIWEVEDMNMNSRNKGGSICSGMPSGKHLKSSNSRHSYNRHLKNKWRKEVKRQFEEEINEI